MRLYHVIRSRQRENQFGAFAGEMLRTEGFMGFQTVDLDSEPWPEIQADDVLLITRCFLRTAEVTRLYELIREGARAVVLAGQGTLLEAFGLKPRHQVMMHARLRLGMDCPASETEMTMLTPLMECGMASDDADQWARVADVLDADGHVTYPAAVIGTCGKGRIGFFFYDLAAEVVRIRFGDPALASMTTLGFHWPHAADMFVHQTDPEAAKLPAADVQMQLLGHVITAVSDVPLGRLWYYPSYRQSTAAVVQSDGDGSEPYEFDALAQAVAKRGGAVTFYLMGNTKLDREHVDRLRAAGHTFGPHVFPLEGHEELYFNFPEQLERQTASFDARFGDRSRTLQCHFAPWMGTTELVPCHRRLGYDMLFAYLSLGPIDPVSRQASPTSNMWNHYMCGSSRPMRFCSPQGEVFDCWQQPVVQFDDASVRGFLTDHADRARSEFAQSFEAVCQRYHVPVPILSHPLSFYQYSHGVMEFVFDLLQANDAPIMNGDAWLDFTSQRDSVRMQQDVRDGKCIVRLSHAVGPTALMIPMDQENAHGLSAAVNGHMVSGKVLQRLGRCYACFDLDGQPAGSTMEVVFDLQRN